MRVLPPVQGSGCNCVPARTMCTGGGGGGGGATIYYSEDVFGIALSDSTALSTWLYGGLTGGMYPFTFCRVQTERGYWQSTRLAGTGEIKGM